MSEQRVPGQAGEGRLRLVRKGDDRIPGMPGSPDDFHGLIAFPRLGNGQQQGGRAEKRPSVMQEFTGIQAECRDSLPGGQAGKRFRDEEGTAHPCCDDTGESS